MSAKYANYLAMNQSNNHNFTNTNTGSNQNRKKMFSSKNNHDHTENNNSRPLTLNKDDQGTNHINNGGYVNIRTKINDL